MTGEMGVWFHRDQGTNTAADLMATLSVFLRDKNRKVTVMTPDGETTEFGITTEAGGRRLVLVPEKYINLLGGFKKYQKAKKGAQRRAKK